MSKWSDSIWNSVYAFVINCLHSRRFWLRVLKSRRWLVQDTTAIKAVGKAALYPDGIFKNNKNPNEKSKNITWSVEEEALKHHKVIYLPKSKTGRKWGYWWSSTHPTSTHPSKLILKHQPKSMISTMCLVLMPVLKLLVCQPSESFWKTPPPSIKNGIFKTLCWWTNSTWGTLSVKW